MTMFIWKIQENLGKNLKAYKTFQHSFTFVRDLLEKWEQSVNAVGFGKRQPHAVACSRCAAPQTVWKPSGPAEKLRRPHQH